MNTSEILEAIDEQISKLQQARDLLADAPAVPAAKPAAAGKRRGRPKGSVNKKAEVSAPVVTKRTMSAEGKARIAAAQKARWASQRKTAAKSAKKSAKSAATAKKAVKGVTKPKLAKKSTATKVPATPLADASF
jgi:hypothetical protein